ncbi:MAG: LysM peptidoglycan-binding domain-containing protein [Chloroflexi bacterium]|nr:LysM peptidoglycan-binding domain-containing protein [Chloroflexota bacterium]
MRFPESTPLKNSFKCWRVIPLLLIVVLVVTIPLARPRISDAQDGGQTYTVQSGENLFRIALRYGLTVDQLAAANGITDPTRIYVGQVLVIPAPGSGPAAPVNTAPTITTSDPVAVASNPAPADSALIHIVQPGQTLASIAQQYGVAWQDLATWNNLTDPNTIFAGQRLVVNGAAAPGSAAVAGPTIVQNAPATTGTERTHVVQIGEHLASIARLYGLRWTTIARANNLQNPNQIYAGQQLIIPAQDDPAGTNFVPTGGVPSAPAPTITNGKQIIVNLSEQRIYAYENGVLMRAVTVSTGLPGTPTVTGDYRIYWKLNSQTMSGPGYYLPGVPWVMYFYQGYAIHGTYWHNNFGQPMSHGCVNLPTPEALWFFDWAEVGTPVQVNY